MLLDHNEKRSLHHAPPLQLDQQVSLSKQTDSNNLISPQGFNELKKNVQIFGYDL